MRCLQHKVNGVRLPHSVAGSSHLCVAVDPTRTPGSPQLSSFLLPAPSEFHFDCLLSVAGGWTGDRLTYQFVSHLGLESRRYLRKVGERLLRCQLRFCLDKKGKICLQKEMKKKTWHFLKRWCWSRLKVFGAVAILLWIVFHHRLTNIYIKSQGFFSDV